jgi:hypothetical protein
MRDQTDEEADHSHDMLNNKELVGSGSQLSIWRYTYSLRKLAKLEKTIQAINTMATVPLANRASFVKYREVTASSCHSSPMVSHFERSIVPVWIMENRTGCLAQSLPCHLQIALAPHW